MKLYPGQKDALKQLRSMPGWDVFLAIVRDRENAARNAEHAVAPALPDHDFKAEILRWRGYGDAWREAQLLVDNILREET